MKVFFTNDVEHTGMNGKTWERIAQQVDEVTLPRLLDLYDKYNVKSTFFVLGQVAELRPNIVKQIVAHHQEVASHGYQHDRARAFDVMSLDDQIAELKKSKELLEQICGQEVVSFRAPALRVNCDTPVALREAGFKFDSSVASQRLDAFMSYGAKGKQQWLKAPRAIYETAPDNLARRGNSGIVEVPVVTTFHNGETLNWHVNLMASLMSLRARHVIYVAQHIRDLSYFKAKNYSIIPCGVPMEQMIITPKEEARKQLGWDADKKYILFGGAFSNERKNYALLRDAVKKIQMANDQCQIECLEMRGLSRAECVLRMCACDLFALPSHSEGSPQALKEAMAVNCPCLATDIADVRELFGNEAGHWILRNPRKTLERWDADEKSLDEMTELLKAALQFEGRTKGRERILELGLSNEQVARRIIEIYNSLCES